MGCDIHLFTEAKIYNNKWHCCDYFRLNEFYGDDEYEKQWIHVPVYQDRDYKIFSMLANVRNYNNIPFIDEARGLPCDVTDTVKKASDDYGSDGHHHSYITVRELFEYYKKHTGKYDNDVDFFIRVCSFINKIKSKMIECFYIGGDNINIQNEILKNADKFRIVFWFDN